MRKEIEIRVGFELVGCSDKGGLLVPYDSAREG